MGESLLERVPSEKVCGEGPSEKFRWRRSVGEGP